MAIRFRRRALQGGSLGQPSTDDAVIAVRPPAANGEDLLGTAGRRESHIGTDGSVPRWDENHLAPWT